ncbi:MAG: LamG domain-containing protein [Candidatus Wildermuthbacteria bacterium]|nr:LamG domain-containing protein [Candidatus Wildermuthbacteria bacterium]
MGFLFLRKMFLSLLLITVSVGIFGLFFALQTAVAVSPPDADAFGFAWSETVGWISFNSEDDFGIPIVASSDDAYHAAGGWPDYSNTDVGVYAGRPNSKRTVGGWRWTDLEIPAGATIQEAYVRLKNREGTVTTLTTALAFQLASDPSPFPADALSGDTPLERWDIPGGITSTVNWNWYNTREDTSTFFGWSKTPNLRVGLKQVVDSLGPGGVLNSVVLLEKKTSDSGSQNHLWESYEGDRNGAARLYVRWTLGGESFSNIPPAAEAYKVQADFDTGILKGYAWSPNVGWVNFDRAVTGPPPSDDVCPGGECIARIDMTAGGTVCGGSTYDICGWARVIAACQDSLWDGAKCTGVGAGNLAGGWDGWIKLRGSGGDGLVAHWGLDDGALYGLGETTVRDSVGGNDGILSSLASGAPDDMWQVPGGTVQVAPGALEFDNPRSSNSQEDYVAVRDIVSGPPPKPCGTHELMPCVITVAAWVNVESPTDFTRYEVVSMDNNYILVVEQQSDGGPLFKVNNAGGSNTYAIAESNMDILDGDWHHIAGTFDGSNVRIYVDGVEKGIEPYSGDIQYSITDTCNDKKVCSDPPVPPPPPDPLNGYIPGDNGRYDLYFGTDPRARNSDYRGFMDDIRIYNRALDAGEINALIAGGGGGNYGLKWEKTTREVEGWAWGGDVVGWISFNSGTDGAIPQYAVTLDLNAPPSAINLGAQDLAGGGAYCSANTGRVELHWDFSDPNPDDVQDAFQVLVQEVADSFAVCLAGGCPVATNSCPGMDSDIPNPTGGTCDPGNTAEVYIPTSGNILNVSHPLFNRTLLSQDAYYWAVRVKDDQGVWAKWSEWAPLDPPQAPAPAITNWPSAGRFYTIMHRAPAPSFEIVPENPVLGEVVEFRDTSRCWCSQPGNINQTNLPFNCADSPPADCAAGAYTPEYKWEVGGGGWTCDSTSDPSCRGSQERIFDDLLTGQTMKLTVTEPTYGNFCSYQQSFNVHIPFPGWREVSPF